MTYPSSIKNIKAGKLVRALTRDGFYLDRASGARQIFLHSDGRRVAVHYHHSGQTFPIGTLTAMLQDTHWTPQDLKRLKLIPKRDP